MLAAGPGRWSLCRGPGSRLGLPHRAAAVAQLHTACRRALPALVQGTDGLASRPVTGALPAVEVELPAARYDTAADQASLEELWEACLNASQQQAQGEVLAGGSDASPGATHACSGAGTCGGRLLLRKSLAGGDSSVPSWWQLEQFLGAFVHASPYAGGPARGCWHCMRGGTEAPAGD